MLTFPPLPFPPQTIHESDECLLVVGMNGEIAKLNLDTLEIDGDFVTPFPAEITHSCICDDLFIGTWVEHDIQTALMAAIPVKSTIKTGISKSELRERQNGDSTFIEIPCATWSHTLDSEPLAITSDDETVAFTNYLRGTYRVDSDSNEIWRIPELALDTDDIPDGGEITHSLFITENGEGKVLNLWTIGGQCFKINWETGDLLQSSRPIERGIVDSVHNNKSGDWLVGLSNGEIVWWNSKSGESKVRVGGPIHDATFIDDAWKILGWREDIHWRGEEMPKSSRPELGVCLYNHPKSGLLVLDNRGTWSKFLA